MEQNAFDLLVLFVGFLSVVALPVVIGIIAVLREKVD
jgi:hypothetical protein